MKRALKIKTRVLCGSGAVHCQAHYTHAAGELPNQPDVGAHLSVPTLQLCDFVQVTHVSCPEFLSNKVDK